MAARDGCPRACHLCGATVHRKAYGAEPGAVREPPCASGTCSEQEAGTRSLGSLCRELRATRVSAAHATAARAVARRGAACMRRRRELPRRPAVCRRLHQPPRALANSVHPCDAVAVGRIREAQAELRLRSGARRLGRCPCLACHASFFFGKGSCLRAVLAVLAIGFGGSLRGGVHPDFLTCS